MLGLVGAIEVVKNKRLDFDFEDRVGWKIYLEGLKNNVILRPLGNVIYFYLPLTIKKKEIDDILKRSEISIINAIKKLTNKIY